MAVLKVVNGKVVVQLSRLEALGAARCFHPTVSVPLDKVRAVYVSDNPWVVFGPTWAVALGKCGTFIPRVILLGTVWRRKDKRFAAVRRNKPAVVLEMEPDSAGWSVIVVSVDENAQELSAELQRAVMEAKGASSGSQQQDTGAGQRQDVPPAAAAGETAECAAWR